MDDLYRQQIIDRYKHPLKRGVLDPHDLSYEDENPLCGDRIRIDLRTDAKGTVTEAAFSGDGCAISRDSELGAVFGWESTAQRVPLGAQRRFFRNQAR